MDFLQQFYSNPIIHALGLSLLHACWQIIIIAVCLKLILRMTESKSAHLAYWIAVGGLLAALIWSGFTFYQQYEHFDYSIRLAYQTAEKTAGESYVLNLPEVRVREEPANVIQQARNKQDQWIQIEAYLPCLVLLWGLGAIIFIFRFGLGWAHIYRLRREGLFAVDAIIRQRFEQLCGKVGLPRPPGLFLSAIVKEPLTFGHFKPVILLPLGLLSNLSPEMVEAVLLHELAHIKRSDYLINVLQSFIEIIFFFHPGIWWISKKVRLIREHACDDLALNVCRNPMLYAETLTQVQFLFLSSKNNLAMSASGKTGDFTTRIKRLFGYSKPEGRNRNLLLSSLLLSCLLAFAFENPLGMEDELTSFPTVDQPNEAMLYFITPTTSVKQLDKIAASFAQHNVKLEFSDITFKTFGLLDDLTLSFTMPDESERVIAVDHFKYVCIILDWNKAYPLDVRFVASGINLDFTNEEGNMSSFPPPYSSNFMYPANVGAIGIKQKEGANSQALFIKPEAESDFTVILNGDEITPEEFVQKDLGASDILAIYQLNSNQAKEKFGKEYPNGVYEIFAKLDKNGNKRTFFSKSKDALLKLHSFKVLHKAELIAADQRSNMVKYPGDEITISADDCNKADKAFQVLNDQVLDVPDGHCYPPEILQLTEVDSFFLLDGTIGEQRYGEAANAGAYVYYYQAKTKPDEANPDRAYLSPSTPMDTIIMYSVILENIKYPEVPLLTYYNNQEVIFEGNAWPEKIKNLEKFDSIMIVKGRSAAKSFGEENRKGVVFLFKDDPSKRHSEGEKKNAPKTKNSLLKEGLNVFPNPFSNQTTIEFELQTYSFIKVYIFDGNGRQIEALAERYMDKGKHQFTWVPKGIANGVYQVLVQTKDETYSEEIVLMK